MTTVHFLHDFDFTPEGNRNVTIAYRAGTTIEVCAECAAKAIARGAAEEVVVDAEAIEIEAGDEPGED
ncbi:hypothetical protein ACFODL_15530 [Phenylobacterium terrae]|uniref:Uncharacterized protein n=1 Tax=Phenylobacterium terrae TaxID=2665495 RepID=A0ABW4N6L7_9CAUL